LRNLFLRSTVIDNKSSIEKDNILERNAGLWLPSVPLASRGGLIHDRSNEIWVLSILGRFVARTADGDRYDGHGVGGEIGFDGQLALL
jgi:hypothetical protein